MNANPKTRLTVDALEARDVPAVLPLPPLGGFPFDPSPQPSRPIQLGRAPELVAFKPIPIEIQPFRPQLPLPLPKPGAPDPWVVRATLTLEKTVSPQLLDALRNAKSAPAIMPLTRTIGNPVFVG